MTLPLQRTTLYARQEKERQCKFDGIFVLPPTNECKANVHLAHLQALTHNPMLQLAKEPNFCRRTV